jgi:hypothetical protein
MIQLPEGKIILGASAGMGVLCLASLLLYWFLPERVSDRFITLSSCLAGGWGIVLVCWFIGFVWDIFALSSFLTDPNHFDRPPGPMGPGLGLWLGLGLAMGVVVVFAVLLAIRGRALWLYVGEVVGLAAGVLLVVFNVTPWDKGPDMTSQERSRKPLLALETKFARRYWPLSSTFDREKQKMELMERLQRTGRQPTPRPAK